MRTGSHWVNRIVADWQVAAIYTKQSGQPFMWMGTSLDDV